MLATVDGSDVGEAGQFRDEYWFDDVLAGVGDAKLAVVVQAEGEDFRGVAILEVRAVGRGPDGVREDFFCP